MNTHKLALLFTLLCTMLLNTQAFAIAMGDRAPTVRNNAIIPLEATQNSLTISWFEATDDITPQDKMTYIVEWKYPSGLIREATLTNTDTYTITNLQPCTVMGVTVYAEDESGNRTQYAQKEFSTNSGIKIMGKAINYFNKDDVLEDGGKVSYDCETKTLTLNDAEFTYDGVAISVADIGGINILVIGDNRIESTTMQALWSECDTRIYSHARLGFSLHLKGGLMGAGIKGDLTIKNTDAYITTDYGLCGLNMRGNTLSVLGSRFQARVDKNDANPAIVDCYDFIIEGSHIREETSVVFDNKLHKFCKKNSDTESKDVICDLNSLKYYFQLGNTIVSSQNYYDIFGDGTAKFAPNTNTLTLNGASVLADNEERGLFVHEIFGNVPSLNIILEGENSLQGYIYTTKNMTFTGAGTLNVTSSKNSHATLSAEADITIKGGCTINLINTVNGLALFSNDNLIVVDNSTLTMQTLPDEQIIRSCYGLLFKGCRIQSAHRYDAEKGAFYTLNNNTAKGGPVIIAPDSAYNKYDVNQDGSVNAADVVSIYNFIVDGAGSGFSLDRADVNGDAVVNATDVVAVYNYIIEGN